ncbi:NUDIX hydrolase [Foetidibacter luteolus]|uniref:NUDIX hydrolase n=1 Tax=Foetidibacter luteolus TaxID=2608880 RepID=UPI00129AF0EA|nr:NUDIX hydrolase [Foetidibacter luteolus]
MGEHLRWKLLSSEYISKEDWFTVRKDTCEKPDGKIVNNYYVFEFPEWVTCLAITDDGKIILEKQYRHAAGEICIELPGGCVDATDDTLEDAIRREMLEETGYAFETMHYLGKISANPSTNSNMMHMFIATGGKLVQEQELDHNEEIEIFLASFEELFQLMEEKRILQSMHMSTIFYALRYLDKLKYS